MRLPTGRGSMPGYTLLAEHTIVSHDLLADRRFVALAPTLGVFARSAVNAPVGWGGRPWGVLGVYDVQSRVWSPDEVAFVESVANSLGLLLRSVDLAAERHRAGRLADLATAAGGLGRWSWNADLGEVELDDVARAIFIPGGDHAQVDTDVFRTLVSLMGLRAKGTRITLDVPDNVGVMADIAGTVAKMGINISSVSTNISPGSENGLVILRVRTGDVQELVKKLSKKYKVVHVSQTWE